LSESNPSPAERQAHALTVGADLATRLDGIAHLYVTAGSWTGIPQLGVSVSYDCGNPEGHECQKLTAFRAAIDTLGLSVTAAGPLGEDGLAVHADHDRDGTPLQFFVHIGPGAAQEAALSWLAGLGFTVVWPDAASLAVAA